MLACALEGGRACVLLLSFRDGRNLGSRSFFPKLNGAEDAAEVLGAFLTQHYLEQSPPKEIVLSHEVPDQDLIERVLGEIAGRRIELKLQVRTDRARLLQLAKQNAELALRSELASAASQRARLDALQGIATHVVAAGRTHQHTVALEHLHGHLVDPAIGQRAFLEILAALDEGRRVEDHHVPLPALRPRLLQVLEGIGADRFDGIAETVAAGVVADLLAGRARGVDTGDFTRAEACRADAPGADVTEDIQHAHARDQFAQAVAIVLLVEEPTRLLAVLHVDRELEPALVDDAQLERIATPLRKSGYGDYLFQLLANKGQVW
nr:hypothetical protein [Blastomonas sp.]